MSLRARVIAISFVSLLMIFFAAPSFVPQRVRDDPNGSWPRWYTGVSLGLDLQGGIHWVLAVNQQEAFSKRLGAIAGNYEDKSSDAKSSPLNYKVLPAGPQLEVCGATPEKIKEIGGDRDLQRASGGEGDCSRFELTGTAKTRELRRGADQAMEVIKKRVSSMKEPIITREGDDRIIVQLPGGDLDPVRARALISGTTKLEFKKVLAAAESEELLKSRFPNGLPEDTEIRPSADKDEYLLVPTKAILDGTSLEDARLDFERMGQAVVSFTWNSQAGNVFREFTKENIGQRLAAIIDGKVVTAPRINGEIGRNGQIEGNFTQESATDLATQLRSGSLPISLRIEEERTVGPGLGADSIRDGVLSTGFGILFLFIITAIYYKFSGLLACLTLLLNGAIVLGCMGAFEATLTLPGIAGLALTVGMAVDSNIIIFERIREELRAGKSARAALKAGFARSLPTIVDTNLSTLAAAGVLYYIGRGPVQGFGVTLAIGIGATVFCAVTVTRLLMEVTLERRRALRI